LKERGIQGVRLESGRRKTTVIVDREEF